MSTTPHSTYQPFRVPIYPLCDAQGVPILSRGEAIVQWGNELELDGRVNSAFTHIKRLLTGLALKSGGFSESSAVAAIHLTAQLIQLHSITAKKEAYNERLYTRGCNISAATPAAIASLAQLNTNVATDMEDQCIGWFTLDLDKPFWPMTGSVPNVKFEWNMVLGDQVLDLTFSALMPNCIMEDITIPIYDSYLVSAEKKAAITFTGLEHIYPGYPVEGSDVDSAWARVHQAAKKAVPQLELQYLIRSPQHGELVNWHFAQLTRWYEANLLTNPLTSCFKLNLVTPDNTNVDIPIEKCSFKGRGSSKDPWTPISIDLPSSNKGNLLFANSDFVSTTLTWQNTAGNGKGQVPSFSSCHFNEAIIDIGTVPYSPVAGVNFVDCFNPNDSGSMSANSNSNSSSSSIAVHMQRGQFINISGSGYESDPDPTIFRTPMLTETGANIQIKRQKHFGIADAAPISVSLRDIPATVPIELSVEGAAQVFMSDILLHRLDVDSAVDGEPQQYTGINVHESGATFNGIILQGIRDFGYDNLNLKAPNISLSYTAESGAGATTPAFRHLSVDGMRKYIKVASVWQLAKTAGMLRAGITEANQDQVKTLLEVVDQAVAKQHRQLVAPVKKTKSGTTP